MVKFIVIEGDVGFGKTYLLNSIAKHFPTESSLVDMCHLFRRSELSHKFGLVRLQESLFLEWFHENLLNKKTIFLIDNIDFPSKSLNSSYLLNYLRNRLTSLSSESPNEFMVFATCTHVELVDSVCLQPFNSLIATIHRPNVTQREFILRDYIKGVSSPSDSISFLSETQVRFIPCLLHLYIILTNEYCRGIVLGIS